MKKILIFILIFSVSLFLLAENITTTDGQSYLNAKVIDVRVNGIVINYADSNNFDCLRFIDFRQLPENLQKKYNYNKQAADKFDAEHNAWLQKQAEIKEQNKKYEDEILAIQSQVEQQVQDNAIDIEFEARNTLEQGTEGRCWEIYPNGKQVYIGDILLIGEEFGDKGSRWAGNVCRIDQNNAYNGENLPCYAEVNTAYQLLLNKERQNFINSIKQTNRNNNER